MKSVCKVGTIGAPTESIAKHRNECRGGARKRAIPAIDEAKLAPEIDIAYSDQFYFTGTDFVAREAALLRDFDKCGEVVEIHCGCDEL